VIDDVTHVTLKGQTRDSNTLRLIEPYIENSRSPEICCLATIAIVCCKEGRLFYRQLDWLLVSQNTLVIHTKDTRSESVP